MMEEDSDPDEEKWDAAFYGSDFVKKISTNTSVSPDDRKRLSDGKRQSATQITDASFLGSFSPVRGTHSRVIIHLDLDCFYAQVEMICDPSLKNKPLAVRQKNLAVTCNYLARDLGVPKNCYIQDALKACPDLVVVNGEDLTKYREMSYKVTDFLQRFTPLVERLGFDDNFLDVTDLVDKEPWCHLEGITDVKEHIYGFGSSDEFCHLKSRCLDGCHKRLAIGSCIAADIRSQLKQELGLTSCAGVAHNKLLAKLVCGTHKPNQQTTLFPEQSDTLLMSLDKVSRIPGIGHSMNEKLEALAVVTVADLRRTTTSVLGQQLAADQVAWLQNVMYGMDDQPVQKSKLPQTMSEEDSFNNFTNTCRNTCDAYQTMDNLLKSLLRRVLNDGRTPQVLRITIRKVADDVRKRESRQCPIPYTVFRNFNEGHMDTTRAALLELSQKLFVKMVNVDSPFQLAVINVGLTKFTDASSSSGNIENFFSAASGGNTGINSASATQTGDAAFDTSSFSSQVMHGKRNRSGELISSSRSTDNKPSIARFFSPERSETVNSAEQGQTDHRPKPKDDMKECTATVSFSCKKDNIPTVFQRFQKENISISDSQHLKTNLHSGPNGSTKDTQASPQNSRQTSGPKLKLPEGVDPGVFYQLPADIQADILSQLGIKPETKQGAAEMTLMDTTRDQVFSDPCQIINAQKDDEVPVTFEEEVQRPGNTTVGDEQSDNEIKHQNSDRFCFKPPSDDINQKDSTCSSSEITSDNLIESVSDSSACNTRTDTVDSVQDLTASCSNVGKPAALSMISCRKDDVPSDIDPLVFAQLPSDIQKELSAEWHRKTSQSNSASKKKTSMTSPQTAGKSKRAKSTTSPNTSIVKYFQTKREERK